MEQDQIRDHVRTAFAGVRLGSGMSLRQYAAADDHEAGLTRTEFERLPASEITDDWGHVPESDLRHAVTA